jgi:predicted phosphodiesterase
VLLCHGSPWDPDEYVYPDASAEVRERVVAEGQDLVVFGHTHHQLLWDFDLAKAVNPGSVGQRRDRSLGACWASWDTGSNKIVLRREPYDPAKLIAECRQRDPHLPYLADVLERP